MNDQINLNQAQEYVLKLVSEAGNILKKYFSSGKFTSKSKGGVDLITQADEEIDKFLRENIKRQYPQTFLLTEETAPKDYSSLKKMDNLWVIDPIDGTVNFARGNPHFAISVGLVNKGISKLGVVYLPMENNLYWAQADKEEACLNGRTLKVSSTRELKETVFGCDWGWEKGERLILIRWLDKIVPHVRQIKCANSAVAEPATLANGKMDVYLIYGIKPWDIAASSLFIRKAGGKITTPSGEDWDIFNPAMLATNGILHNKILELINK